MTTLPRGQCAVCSKDVPLRRNGTVREHPQYRYSRVVCSGSGKPPVIAAAPRMGKDPS